MSDITITLPNKRLVKLKEKSAQLGLTPELFVLRSVEAVLDYGTEQHSTSDFAEWMAAYQAWLASFSKEPSPSEQSGTDFLLSIAGMFESDIGATSENAQAVVTEFILNKHGKMAHGSADR